MTDTQEITVTNKVLTAPNVITLCRFLLIPLFVYMRLFTVYKAAALAIFVLAACTDWVDGQVARRTGQVSKVGKVFDPLVDRFLLATGVVVVCIEGNLPVWIVVLLVMRDIVLVIEGRIQLYLMGKLDPVSYIGKFATTFLLFGFSFLLLGVPTVGGLGLIEASWLPGLGASPALLGIYLVYIGTILSLTVFVVYNIRGWGAYYYQVKAGIKRMPKQQ